MMEMMEFYELYKKMKAAGALGGIEGMNTNNYGDKSNAKKPTNTKDSKSELNETDVEIKQIKGHKKNYKATRPVDQNEFETIVSLAKTGFKYEDKKTGKIKTFRPNPSLAFALTLQATVGLRASDITNMKVEDFSNGKFSIREIKTGKWQNRDLGESMYNKILEYAMENKLSKEDYIYPNKIRNMQQQLKIITDYLGYKNVGTHSFRKFFAHTLYEESGHDIELVRHVLNHSDIKTTMRYLGVSMVKLKEVTSKIDFSYIL